MNDSLLMGMLHGLADLDEQLQPLRGLSRALSQYSVIGMPRTSSMTKYGRPAVGRTRIEHLGDVRMVHHRQRLPLGLEAGDHLLGVHARLDDLQRDAAADRLGLLGDIDDAHAPFADLLQQLVGADERADAFRGRGVSSVAATPGGGETRKRDSCSCTRSSDWIRSRITASSPHTCFR